MYNSLNITITQYNVLENTKNDCMHVLGLTLQLQSHLHIVASKSFSSAYKGLYVIIFIGGIIACEYLQALLTTIISCTDSRMLSFSKITPFCMYASRL